MAARSSLNVSLTPELEEFVQGRVATGRYQTASEVVREGLRLLEVQEREREAAYKALKKKLRRAAERSDASDTIDGEAYFERLFERMRQGSTK